MAWIEQTKKGSRKSGGPQYYLQDISEHSRELLKVYKQRPVRLWTPYGVVDSGLTAVSSDVGKVGHDRIQTGGRGKVANIADQIAGWYNLNRADIESLEFDDSFDNDSFVIRPSYAKFFNRRARKTLYPDSHPLTLIAGHQSALLTDHIRAMTASLGKDWRAWLHQEIGGLVEEHERRAPDVDERDLLRASGALRKIGIRIGMYRRAGIDCVDGVFKFDGYPDYPCPIEIEERSSGFLAAHHEEHRSQRVVLLCMTHDAPHVLGGYVDILEIRQLAMLLQEVA